jgi:hypothetical protein
MPIFDLFSKRQKILRGEVPDVYIYDEIPKELRVQIIHIWSDAFGEPSLAMSSQGADYIRQAYDAIENVLVREFGVFSLSKTSSRDYRAPLRSLLLSTEEVEEVSDVIELSFQCIDTLVREHNYQMSVKPPLKPDEAIEELNQRFREHGVGYQYESGELVRIDSELIHTEVVKPALRFLSENEYQGANEEYRVAHEHYRHQRYKECLNECLKAFESTMKTICDKRGWGYSPTDTASKLIDVCFNNGLIPSFLQSEFTSLGSSLKAGVPTVRNKMGGHGQGSTPTAVPSYLASYLLHLTATNILLLVEAEKELP